MRINKKLVFYLFIVICFFSYGIYLMKTNKGSYTPPQSTLNPPTAPPQVIASQSAEIVVVKRVIDGDTIELIDGQKVRYLGVDTPELHHPTKAVQCFGKEAMEKNRDLVEGKEIKMMRDVSETDRYKRLLRYVWVGDIFVNEYLAREGFAHQATFPPDVLYVELFRKAAEEARLKNKGLWNSCK